MPIVERPVEGFPGLIRGEGQPTPLPRPRVPHRDGELLPSLVLDNHLLHLALAALLLRLWHWTSFDLIPYVLIHLLTTPRACGVAILDAPVVVHALGWRARWAYWHGRSYCWPEATERARTPPLTLFASCHVPGCMPSNGSHLSTLAMLSRASGLAPMAQNS